MASDYGTDGQSVRRSVELPYGDAIGIEIKTAVRPNLAQAQRLIEKPSRQGTPDVAIRMLVADAIPQSVRALLKDAHWGYLDRRGHLRLEAPNVLIDADVHPSLPGRQRMKEPLRGLAGRSYAAAVLMNRRNPPGVREVARAVGMSASAVSDSARLLREASLVERDGRPLIPDLFWALAEVWKPHFVPLARQPDPQLLLLSLLEEINFENPELSGWAVTGTAAAVSWGAPIAAISTTPLDFYVPSENAARRAMLALDAAANWEQRRCAVAVAPTPLACLSRQERPNVLFGEWPVTRPLFVALDLAQDKARGVEILNDWTPEGDVRVW
ncbi:MAG: hypothetical protein ACRDY1_01880 [Acidimicrobiales bacterium]